MTGDELEALVKKHLYFDYEAVADNEWNNGSQYTSDNVKKSDYQEEFFQTYDLPELKARVDGGNESISFHVILVVLVNAGILPEGNFIIDPSW
jgi:hypothetical protein